MIESPEKLPVASKHIEVKSDLEGYVSGFDAEKVGISAMMLGAGRKKKEDPIDYAAGITLKKKIGDHVNLGDVLCVLHTNEEKTVEAEKMVRAAFVFSAHEPEPIKYIYEIVE